MPYPFYIISTIALMLMAATPATGQLTSNVPTDRPIAEGETLLEWAQPSILNYDIPPEKRGDLSSCSTRYETRLDQVVKTCWPLLQVAQLYIRLDFAAGEPSGDKRKHQQRALGYAEEIIDLIGKPKWPLEKYFLMKTYENLGHIYRDRGETGKALAAVEKQIENITGTHGYDLEFRLAFAQLERSKHLLALNRTAEARENLTTSYALLGGVTGYKNALPIARHNALIARDAIRSGDYTYAEAVIDRYLADARGMDKGYQFGLIDHIDLKIFLLAGRDDVAAVLTLIDQRLAQTKDYSPCSVGDRYFPYVLAPLHTNAEIAEKLATMSCDAKALVKMNAIGEQGILDANGDLLLPPRP